MDRKKLVVLHLVCWFLITVSAAVRPSFTWEGFVLSPADPGLFFRHLLIATGFSVVSAAAFYGSYTFIGSWLFQRRRYARALLNLLLVLGGLVLLRAFIEFVIFKVLFGYDNYLGRQPSLSFYVSNVILYYAPTYVLYGLIYFLAAHWYRQERFREEARSENLAGELAFLRGQVNPHFLFNTLNDIYSLSFQGLPEAPEALLILSRLLRYMIKEGASEQVPLQHEIDYLKDLVLLKQISSKGIACISFEVEGEINEIKVAPLLFVAFVENAFKHGVIMDAAAPVFIRIAVKYKQLQFDCHNAISSGGKDKTGGIGLPNVRRRLELLYPRHVLDIRNDEKHFNVMLKLDLP